MTDAAGYSTLQALSRATGVTMIRGNEVCLTAIGAGDGEAMLAWINDADTVRLSAPWHPVSPAEHQRWLDGLGGERSRSVLAIRQLDNPAIIGVVQLQDIHPVHRCAELVIRIGAERHRGQGWGTEALRLALGHAWEDLNLQRVWLRVLTDNHRAIRAYEKAGFQHEGTMRRAAWIGGRWQDVAICAALRASP